MAREIDELNIPMSYSRSEPFEQYFGDMELTDEEKEKRIKVAEDLDDLMLFIFALISVMRENNAVDKDYVSLQINNRYMAILQGYMGIDKYLEDYIRQFSNTFIQTTFESIDDEWYLSADRARFISENESETTWNYDEYRQAIESGKTRKQWVDIMDKRERKTHREVGGTVIPIEDVFVVGDSLMRYPKDNLYGAEAKEIINCRCTIKYF